MWFAIIIVLVILGFVIFKKLDRDFILAEPQGGKKYHLTFENGKNPVCELIDIFPRGDQKYYVFVPLESLKNIPDEDIIILRCIRENEKKLAFVFAEKDADEEIYVILKTKYAGKYHFAE